MKEPLVNVYLVQLIGNEVAYYETSRILLVSANSEKHFPSSVLNLRLILDF